MGKKYIFIYAFLILIGIPLTYFLFQSKNRTPPISPIIQEIVHIGQNPSPTPFQFIELTIPFLRQRKYQSILSDLEKVSENGSYTSYLTKYDSDGLKINGLLTVPIGDNPPSTGRPAIVFNHGYIPPQQYRTLINYSSFVDYLARNGFVVFKIDLRGHAESEGEPGGAYYSSDYIIDVLNAIASLKSSDIVNPDKIGLWGHSMAGNVVLRSLAAQPQIPAAVIWAGAVYTYSDMQKYGIQDGSYRPPQTSSDRQRKRQQLRELYGEFNPDHPFWQQVSAVNYLKDIKGAIQLNHAVDDSVVNIGYSRDLAELLQINKVNYELKEYQYGGHNLTGASFGTAMQNTVEFFKKNL